VPGKRIVMIATALVGGIIIILSTRLKLPKKSALDKVPFLFGIAFAHAGRSIDKLRDVVPCPWNPRSSISG
jgi:hypothetical protein